VAGLVQDRHERRVHVRLVVACGQAHVVRHAAAERVRALVQAAVREVKAERAHQPLAQHLLPGEGKRPDEQQGRGLARQHVVDEIRQERGKRLEQGVHLAGADARLVIVEERIVGGEPERFGLGF
jgi:hypothetical protein